MQRLHFAPCILSTTHHPSNTESPTHVLPQQRKLTNLPRDVHSHIVKIIANDAARGTPHYPQKYSPSFLALAIASPKHFAQLVARHLPSDEPWISIHKINSDKHPTPHPDDIYQWYNLAYPYLTKFHLHAHARDNPQVFSPHLRLRITNLLINNNPTPPLRHIDLKQAIPSSDAPLSSLDQTTRDLCAVIRSLLIRTCPTLTSLVIDAIPPMADMLTDLTLPNVSTLHIHHCSTTTPSPLLAILHVISPSILTHLSLTLHTPIPTYAMSMLIIYNKLTTLNVSVPMEDIQSSNTTEALLTAFPKHNLTSLTLDNVTLTPAVRNALPSSASVSVSRMCFLSAHMPTLTWFSNRLRSLNLGSYALSPMDLCQLADGCSCIQKAELTVSAQGVLNLPMALKKWQGLKILSLTLLKEHSEDGEVRRFVDSNDALIIELSRLPLLHRLVLLGAHLDVNAIHELVFPRQLEYLVVGVARTCGSVIRTMHAALQIIQSVKPPLRVLCMGLELMTDRYARFLDPYLREAIRRTGKAVRTLDTDWLIRNADALMRLLESSDDEMEVSCAS